MTGRWHMVAYISR